MGTVINALTRSRSPEFHRRSMLKVIIVAGLAILLWEPIRPLRHVTAEALYTAGDLIRR